MRCGECGYTEFVEGMGLQKCSFTGEVRMYMDECNCNDRRSLQDRAKEVSGNRVIALKTLENIRESLGYKSIDAQHLLDILMDTTKEAEVKITEATKYLEDFV